MRIRNLALSVLRFVQYPIQHSHEGHATSSSTNRGHSRRPLRCVPQPALRYGGPPTPRCLTLDSYMPKSPFVDSAPPSFFPHPVGSSSCFASISPLSHNFSPSPPVNTPFPRTTVRISIPLLMPRSLKPLSGQLANLVVCSVTGKLKDETPKGGQTASHWRELGVGMTGRHSIEKIPAAG